MEGLTMKRARHLLYLLLVFSVSCGPDENVAPPGEEPLRPARTTPRINYSLVNRYPHDESAFTEGFLFYGDKLLESTGDVDHLPQTRSVIGEADLKTGKLHVKAELDKKKYFGEGIAVLNGKIYQLTYQDKTGFIYDAKTYKQTGQFTYDTEGWGLTTDGQSLIMSDGTYNLTYLDPQTFRVTKVLPVTRDGYGLDHVNELEYINGFIYANVWMTSTIVKIDPSSGVVTGQLDLSALQEEARRKNPQISEMNGIAWHREKDQVLVTGKMWPYIFEISFPH